MSDPTIQANEFSAFFEAVHGVVPFAWQVRLAREICERGRFPDEISLPTAFGKTALIDMAVFFLASDLASGRKRRAPLRIAWVIDRRIVVDEAYKRAVQIARKLGGAKPGGILARMRDALRTQALEVPLVAQRLRGGLPREGDWARSPAQPTVLVSTVDQVGSRLLFRGYGISEGMRPIHAGLLGNDTLIVVDEAHLSGPFCKTLDGIAQQRVRNGAQSERWHIARVSATNIPNADAEWRFQADQDVDFSDELLERRYRAPKTISLVKRRLEADSEEHAQAIAAELLGLAMKTWTTPPRLLAVVNRVATARRVFEAVRDQYPDALLVMGRNRDIEKDRIANLLSQRFAASLDRAVLDAPQFVVATQAIEAGADLDFDGLVTEIASADALIQRLGRLNRLGRCPDAKGVVFATDEQLSTRYDDAIYGRTLRPTWDWLSVWAERSVLDLSPASIADHQPGDECYLRLDDKTVPPLLSSYVNDLVISRYPPARSRDVSLYLRGHQQDLDVSIVFRADLPRRDGRLDRDGVTELLAIVPPRPSEALDVPISAAAAWVNGRREVPVADVESAEAGADAPAEPSSGIAGSKRVDSILEWRDGQAHDVNGRLRPGMLLIADAELGSCDPFGWDPRSKSPVRDVGTDAAVPYAGSAFALRLHPALTPAAWPQVKEITDAWGEEDAAARILSMAPEDLGISDGVRRALDRVKSKLELWPAAEDRAVYGGVILRARRGIVIEREDTDDSDLDSDDIIGRGISATEDDLLSAAPSPTTEGPLALTQHLADVRAEAAKFCEQDIGLSREESEDVCLAAYLHDLGKADPRFQLYLVGFSSRIAAKSGKARSKRDDRAARRASGLPDGFRHEALSVRIAAQHPSFADAHDPDLVLYLIGTHHGYGREAFFFADAGDREEKMLHGFSPHEAENLRLPASPGPQSPEYRSPSDLDWSTLCRRLLDKYGAWRLALLEATLRLADHRASEKPGASLTEGAR